MMKKRHISIIILYAIGLTFLVGCKYKISLSGVKFPADVKTISIEKFDNEAKIVVPALTQFFTEKLRDTFLGRSNFKLVEENGDLQLTGKITRYDIQPVAIGGEIDRAEQSRLTITVKCTMYSENHDELGWDNETFSNFADFGINEELSAVENELIQEASERISLDIFNRAFANW